MQAYKITVAVLLSLFAVEARAADLTPVPEQPAVVLGSDWTFTFAPYMWATAIKGKSGLFGLPPQDIDVKFSDILKNLDGGLMGVGEARNGRFIVGMDIMYAHLSTTIDTPKGIAATTIDATGETFTGTAVVGYSVLYDPHYNVDVVAGGRVWYSNTEFEFNGGLLNGTSRSDGATWVDPLVGMKFRADIGSGFYVAGWGLVGGFDVSSKRMWDVMGGVGYAFTDSTSMYAGYRALGVDYESNGFVYDVVQQGPILGLVCRF